MSRGQSSPLRLVDNMIPGIVSYSEAHPTDCMLATTDYMLATTDCMLATTDYMLATTDCLLATTDYMLATTD